MDNLANNAESTVVHAYGIVPAGTPGPGVVGLGGAAVDVMPLGDVAVLVSRLSQAGYGTAVWEGHAEDPQWLGEVAAAHHNVLQSMIETTDVLPLRLPTIQPDETALERALTEILAELSAALDRVRGHIELGAKAFVVAEPRAEAEPATKMTGRQYLARRKAQADLREAARLRRQQELVDAHEAMAAAATDATTSRPQDPALSGRPEPMVLNSAYLVPRDRFDDFVAVAEQVGADLRADGIALEVTGPWPPYNFVAERATAAADQGDGSSR